MDLFENIGIGINLKLGISIWYRYDFWVSVSGIGMDLGYRHRYWYEYSSGYRYRYQGIGGTLTDRWTDRQWVGDEKLDLSLNSAQLERAVWDELCNKRFSIVYCMADHNLVWD